MICGNTTCVIKDKSQYCGDGTIGKEGACQHEDLLGPQNPCKSLLGVEALPQSDSEQQKQRIPRSQHDSLTQQLLGSFSQAESEGGRQLRPPEAQTLNARTPT